MAALGNQYGTEASVYKGEGKEFISLLNRTLSDAYHALGLSLAAGESLLDKMGRPAGREKVGPGLPHLMSPVVFTTTQ